VLCLLLGACATAPAPRPWRPTPAERLSAPLSLGDCLNLAFANDVRVAQWRANLQSARADLAATREIPNPSFQATWEDIGLKDAAGQSLATSAYGLDFPIFFWWTRGPETDAARAGVRSRQAANAGEHRQLAREIGTAYYALAAAQRRERFERQLLATEREELRLAQESFKLGDVAQHHVDQAEAELMQAQADLDAAGHECRLQGLALAFALGADRPTPVQARDDDDASSPVLLADLPTSGPLPQALEREILARDPTLAKARAERQAAEARLAAEQRRRLPLSDAQLLASRKNDPEGMAGLIEFSVPIPLFNWRGAAVRKARAELDAARAAEEQARRDVVARLTDAWERFEYARRHCESSVQPLVRRRASLAQASRDLFAAGQIGYLDLLQAQRDWIQAELAGVEAWNELRTSLWTLRCEMMDKALGMPRDPKGGGDGS
jgi:cobalt-zinc-cadmium efflux system outer membrane protein